MNSLPAPLRWILESIALALVYVVAGKLGQAMALPGTNLALLWPPSGIALAAVLRMGPRSLPGLWIGAVIVNSWSFMDLPSSPSTEMVVLASLVIGAGAILQPYLGALAVKRFSNPSNPLSDIRTGTAFAVIVPLMCLISAAIGSSTLVGTDLIPNDLFKITLTTWWLGDMIGVLIFTPFTLLLWRMTPQRQGILFCVIIAGFLATYTASTSLRDQSAKVWESQADRTTDQLTSVFLLWLDLSYSSVHGITAVFSGSGEVSEDEFLDVVDSLEEAQGAYFPSSLAYAQRQDGAVNWSVSLSTDDQGLLADESDIAPGTPLASVIGTAWSDFGTMHITIGKSESEDRLMYAAIRADSETQDGVLIAAINLTATLDGLFYRPEAQGLKLRMSGETLNSKGEIERLLLYGPADANPETVRSVPYRTVSGDTVLDFLWDVSPDFADGVDYDLANAVLIGGLISTILAALFIMFLLLQNESIAARVRERTEEVSSKTKLLQAVMGSLNQGIAAYDRDLNLIAYNDRFLDIRGYSKDLVFEGQSFEAFMRYDMENDEFGDGDPEEIFQEKVRTARQFYNHQFERKRPNGRFIEVQGGPIPDGGFVSTFSDISERKLTEEKIDQQVSKLEQARLATMNMMADAETARRELQSVLTDVSASITYASRIQRSLLPDDKLFQEMCPDHFCIWEPRDVVGGDMYWVERDRKGYFVVLFDCTGHGVPGALMTTIAVSALRVAFAETADPARLIARVNQIVKRALRQENKHGLSDDGLEMGVCHVEPERMRMTFSGARFELISAIGDQNEVIKGDKSGLGYRHVPYDQRFSNRSIRLRPGQRFYMYSDGIIDQVGGEKNRAFGRKRLINILKDTCHAPLEDQKKSIIQGFEDYQGTEVRRDDVSIIGFVPIR